MGTVAKIEGRGGEKKKEEEEEEGRRRVERKTAKGGEGGEDVEEQIRINQEKRLKYRLRGNQSDKREI